MKCSRCGKEWYAFPKFCSECVERNGTSWISVKDRLCEEFGDIATVKVTKTFADLYRTEDKHETV